MGVLGRFEQRLEEIVRGGFARVFKGQVEPVEIAAALQKEAGERKAVMGPGRIVVPNDFVVTLAPEDGERLLPYATPLGRELVAMVTEHASDEGWQFFGDVRVTLEEDAALTAGVFRVHGEVVADDDADRGSSSSSGHHAGGGAGKPAPPAAPTRVKGRGGRRAGRPRLIVTNGGDVEMDGGSEDDERELTATSTVIGRGSDADLRLSDTGVSRRHAEVRLRDGAAEVLDLASTNGTRLNGRSIDRAPLQDGDRLEVGSTSLVFRQETSGQQSPRQSAPRQDP